MAVMCLVHTSKFTDIYFVNTLLEKECCNFHCSRVWPRIWNETL